MKYTIGEKEFDKKQHITDYIRVKLDSLPENKIIDLDSTLGKFACELMKLNPRYDGFLDYAKYVKLTVIRDKREAVRGYGNYKTFNFYFIDNNDSKVSWPLPITKLIEIIK